MSLNKLLLVGLDNPQSTDPRYALFPAPEKCTGWRIWKFINEADPNFTKAMYQRITKTNLFPVGPAPKKISFAHGYAGAVLRVQLASQARRVILLGNQVRDSVMAPDTQEMPDMMEFVGLPGSGMTVYAWIPHPSGRNHFYNDAKSRRKVANWLLNEVHRDG